MNLSLVRPSEQYLESYIEAVRAGFINMQLGKGDERANSITANPQAYFLELLDNSPFVFTTPGNHRFNVEKHEILWAVQKDRFIGSIAMRYKSDKELEEKFCGHIGVSISPQHQRLGHGLGAIKLALPLFKAQGHSAIFYTADHTNAASIKLVEKARGVLVKQIMPEYGLNSVLLYKITL